MLVEHSIRIEIDGFCNQFAKCRLRGRFDLAGDDAERRRKIARPKRQSCQDAEGAAAAALDGPEQVRLIARIDNEGLTVRGDDFRLEKAGGAETVFLRETAKAAAVNEAGDPDRGTATTLHITAAACRDRLVDLQPPRSGLNRHCRL